MEIVFQPTIPERMASMPYEIGRVPKAGYVGAAKDSPIRPIPSSFATRRSRRLTTASSHQGQDDGRAEMILVLGRAEKL